jgi:hypothetical protein
MFSTLLAIAAAVLLSAPAVATIRLSGAMPIMQPISLAGGSLINPRASIAAFDNFKPDNDKLALVDLMSADEIRAQLLRPINPVAPHWTAIIATFFAPHS